MNSPKLGAAASEFMQLMATPGVTITSETFSERTTLGVGGAPRAVINATPERVGEVIRAVRARGYELFLLGGGSNIVAASGELPCVALSVDHADIDYATTESPDRVCVRVGAGAVWDDVVAQSVARGLTGIECLSGIPGTAGAVPVQNVGAYGVEIADVLTQVEMLIDGTTRWIPATELELGYRSSVLKKLPRAERPVILRIEIVLRTGKPAPVRFDAPPTPSGIRTAVLALRASKGMVYSPEDADTHSAGSFFTNPVVPRDDVPEGAPVYPVDSAGSSSPECPTDYVKIPAAWLIEHAGFTKGFSIPGSRARLSTKHTLAITNAGGATTENIVDLACTLRHGVKERYGITLTPEPEAVGFQWEAVCEAWDASH